jgi:hypothetical protein
MYTYKAYTYKAYTYKTYTRAAATPQRVENEL